MTREDDADFQARRLAMVQEQIVRRGIRSPRLLAVLRALPRHLFVPPDQRRWAYSDGALRIPAGQTISQPYIVALMTDLLALQGDEKVLEIGTGSGYQTAVLARLAAQVYTIERHEILSRQAESVLHSLGIDNVHFRVGDGTLGWPEQAPFQAIMVTAAAPRVPSALLEQLDEGGRLVIPVGDLYGQVLQLWRREGTDFASENIAPVAFVPLIGEQGFSSDSGDSHF